MLVGGLDEVHAPRDVRQVDGGLVYAAEFPAADDLAGHAADHVALQQASFPVLHEVHIRVDRRVGRSRIREYVQAFGGQGAVVADGVHHLIGDHRSLVVEEDRRLVVDAGSAGDRGLGFDAVLQYTVAGRFVGGAVRQHDVAEVGVQYPLAYPDRYVVAGTQYLQRAEVQVRTQRVLDSHVGGVVRAHVLEADAVGEPLIGVHPALGTLSLGQDGDVVGVDGTDDLDGVGLHVVVRIGILRTPAHRGTEGEQGPGEVGQPYAVLHAEGYRFTRRYGIDRPAVGVSRSGVIPAGLHHVHVSGVVQRHVGGVGRLGAQVRNVDDRVPAEPPPPGGVVYVDAEVVTALQGSEGYPDGNSGRGHRHGEGYLAGKLPIGVIRVANRVGPGVEESSGHAGLSGYGEVLGSRQIDALGAEQGLVGVPHAVAVAVGKHCEGHGNAVGLHQVVHGVYLEAGGHVLHDAAGPLYA